MKEFFNSYLQRKSGVSRADEEASAMHEIAGDFFGEDFSNPQRIGCPPPETFTRLIAGKNLPDEQLQAHLLGCSECFNEYRTKLRQTKVGQASPKKVSPFGIRLALVSGLATCLIAVGIFVWMRQSNESSTLTAQIENRNLNTAASDIENSEINSGMANVQSPLVVGKNNVNVAPRLDSTNGSRTGQKFPVKESGTMLLAKNEVEIDLNAPIWRDLTTAPVEKSVNLEAKNIRIRIKLPKENPAGIYQVFLTDEFARNLTGKKTVRAKNQTLSVEFDLKNVGGSQKRLCIAPVDEIPDCVPVNVIAPK